MKGQNSIEYLSTYGWMLIALAVGAGVFYSYVPEDTCREQVTDDMSNQLQIADLAVNTEGDLTLLVRNMGAHRATVKQIKAVSGENSTVLDTDKMIRPVEEKAFRLNGTAATESCHQVDLTFQFNSTELGTVQDRGEIEGEFTVVG